MKASYRAGDMSGADRVLARARAYWGEDSGSFRKLKRIVTIFQSSKAIVFYRDNIISLQPFVPGDVPQDISFFHWAEGLVLP
jgi:hypothetical protein